jgi:hypothetical protein
MAPFLTHLVVGERVWHALGEEGPAPGSYGAFLFGCLAPDVDKLCDGLEQGTTHFVAKDEGNTYVWQRSKRFLDSQSQFLRAPFHALEANEQAFVLGYLCHVATDEITGRIALEMKSQIVAGGRPFPRVDAVLCVMDPHFWSMARDPQAVMAALEAAAIPDGTLVFAPLECLAAMHKIVVPQVREGGGMVPYLNMVRRQRRWMRYGEVSDAIDDPSLEAELAAYRRQIEGELPASEQLVGRMELEPFVDEAVSHSLQRLRALLAEGRSQ